MNKKWLSIELNEDLDKLELHGNIEGLRELIKNLKRLIESAGNSDHIHLMTPSWGGCELSDEKQKDENILINMATIFKWSD